MVTPSKVHWMESRLLLGPSLPVSLFLLFSIREDKNHTQKKKKKTLWSPSTFLIPFLTWTPYSQDLKFLKLSPLEKAPQEQKLQVGRLYCIIVKCRDLGKMRCSHGKRQPGWTGSRGAVRRGKHRLLNSESLKAVFQKWTENYFHTWILYSNY